MFGEKPKKARTPIVAGDHPVTGLSEFWDQDQIKQYQIIVGQLIWLTGLGRLDIGVHVMTMSRFRHQPRVITCFYNKREIKWATTLLNNR